MRFSGVTHKRAAKPAARFVKATCKGARKMQERVESESGALIRQCVDILRERFPAVFGATAYPLKVGIGKDVHQALAGLYGRKVIDAAIGRRVRTREYLACLSEGASRVDLSGKPCGRVTAAEQLRAAKQLKMMDCVGGDGDDGLAKKSRAQLLKRFEGSPKTTQEFADLVEMDATDLAQRLAAAAREREQRQAEARELVERWRRSGLSRNQFCKAERIKPRKLETALERMGAVLDVKEAAERAH